MTHPRDVLHGLTPHQQPGHLPHLLAQHNRGHNVTDGLGLSLVPALSVSVYMSILSVSLRDSKGNSKPTLMQLILLAVLLVV